MTATSALLLPPPTADEAAAALGSGGGEEHKEIIRMMVMSCPSCTSSTLNGTKFVTRSTKIMSHEICHTVN